jgi:predicted tellurium resistance membrane protein TerC
MRSAVTSYFFITLLAALLVFTAAKMLASEWVHVSAGVSVAIIGVVLLATIAASVWQKSTPVPAH